MKLRRSEVLRYLGYKNQNIDQSLEELIDSCIEEMSKIAKSLYTFQNFGVQIGKEEVKLLDHETSLKGRSIVNHLQDAKQCIILAATLGTEVDRCIKRYQLTDMTRAVILDACATEAIEGLCDEVEEEIKAQALLKGYYATSRYSPGYGDFPLESQPVLLQLLEAHRRIGLNSTKEHLLIPRKSVTAVIGLIDKPLETVAKGCSACSEKASCRYRREEKNHEFCTK